MTGKTAFDLVVIGAGSGGIAAANRAASHGARVALVEYDRLGGTCVNRGCVPKKLCWLAARTAEDIRNAEGYGFSGLEIHHDFDKFRQARDRYIEFLNGRYAEGLDRNQVHLVRGKACFKDAHTIEVDDTELRGERILIATGARTRPLGIPGAELALDSSDFFALRERPERVAMIGAGYIAAELGGVLAALGSHVDMYLGGRRPLAHFDPFIGDHFHEALEAVGVNCHGGTVARLKRSPKGIDVETGDGDTACYDVVFSAIGRIPNSGELNLDRAGLEPGADGAIPVDALHNTKVGHIHAVGDVTGRAHALTPVAIAAGRRLADRLYGGAPPRPIDPELIPSVVFSHPPVGSVGLTEPEARARHGSDGIRTYTASFTPLSSALSPEKQRAAVKLVTLGPDEKVVGLHIIGDGADEMLQGFAVAIRMGATKRDFDETIAIHPTTAEEVVTLR
ncbi:MAG TPA: glutathione-disulfide reductase [Gammaproteobacteria bacterium]|nr:glutathione-disulfide reductase [Gammaproteobacteria bacterium]